MKYSNFEYLLIIGKKLNVNMFTEQIITIKGMGFGTYQRKKDDILQLKLIVFVINCWNLDIYDCNC